MMQTVLLGIGFIGLFFLLMSTRILLKKDGKFQGTCASQNPMLNQDGENCSFCGKAPSQCENKESNQGFTPIA